MIQEPTEQRSAPGAEADGDLIDYSSLRLDAGYALRAPLRHKRAALACFLLVVALALASSFVVRDVYQAQAGILAQRNPVMLTLSNPGLARGQDWDAPTRAARETVMRRDNLIALCEQTKLVDRYLATRSLLGGLRAKFWSAFTGREPTHAEMTEALADSLESKLWVTVNPEGAVTITFEWTDPDIAFAIVEAAVQNFLEARHATEMAVVGETIALLEGRATKLRSEVDTTLEYLERKERSRPRVSVRRAAPRPAAVPRDDDLARIESTLGARRRALADLEEFRQRRLAELQAQLAQREATYSERHPEVLTARQSIAALAQPSPQMEALRGEVRELEREVARRGGPAGPQSASAPLISPDVLETRSLLEPEDVRSEYDRSQLRLLLGQYSNVLARIDAAKLELETAQAAFKYKYSVISPPTYPKGPKKPYLLLRLLGGLFGGVALAIFVTTAMDIRSGRIVEEWQVERHLGLSVLARFGS